MHGHPPATGKGAPAGRARGDDLLAALDLGTNNCRLLIARPEGGEGFRVVDSFSRIVRLGEGVAATGLISDVVMDRTIEALKSCARHIGRHHVRHVRAVATQAARMARNADRLVARASAEAGVALSVISAEAEAELAALGCIPLIGTAYAGALIFDIGGGSTEIIHVRRGAGGFVQGPSASLPFGVVTLSEQFGTAGRHRAGFEAMRAAMQARFAPLVEDGFDLQGEHLLGTSGTVTTLAALALGLARYDRRRVDASWHETARMLNVADRVSRMDVPALAALGPVGPERADLMLAGTAIFGAICALWPARMLRVGDRGLREGILRQMRAELSL